MLVPYFTVHGVELHLTFEINLGSEPKFLSSSAMKNVYEEIFRGAISVAESYILITIFKFHDRNQSFKRRKKVSTDADGQNRSLKKI